MRTQRTNLMGGGMIVWVASWWHGQCKTQPSCQYMRFWQISLIKWKLNDSKSNTIPMNNDLFYFEWWRRIKFWKTKTQRLKNYIHWPMAIDAIKKGVYLTFPSFWFINNKSNFYTSMELSWDRFTCLSVGYFWSPY